LVEVVLDLIDERRRKCSGVAQDDKILLSLDDLHSSVPHENKNGPFEKGSFY